MHKGGVLIETFKRDHPTISKGIKLAVNTVGEAVGIVVGGTVYVLNPLKPVWEVYSNFVNALVPDIVHEWVNNKGNEGIEGVKNWERGLTSRQRLTLDTAIEGVEFAGNVALVGGTVKLAGKFIIEDTLKVATKVEKPNIATYVDAPELSKKVEIYEVKNIENSVLSHPRVGSAVNLDKYHNFNEIIDNYAGDAAYFSIPTKDYTGVVVRTSELRQLEGSLKHINGVFEWIIDQDQVTHRRFIPGGKVTGFPNQKVSND